MQHCSTDRWSASNSYYSSFVWPMNWLWLIAGCISKTSERTSLGNGTQHQHQQQTSSHYVRTATKAPGRPLACPPSRNAFVFDLVHVPAARARPRRRPIPSRIQLISGLRRAANSGDFLGALVPPGSGDQLVELCRHAARRTDGRTALIKVVSGRCRDEWDGSDTPPAADASLFDERRSSRTDLQTTTWWI